MHRIRVSKRAEVKRKEKEYSMVETYLSGE
jgi:hypothetical protein